IPITYGYSGKSYIHWRFHCVIPTTRSGWRRSNGSVARSARSSPGANSKEPVMKSAIRRGLIVGACSTVLAGAVGVVVPHFSSQVVAQDMKPMMPTKDIIETATGPGMMEVTTVVTAIKAAGLVDTLKGKGPFTVFAPTNAAFEKLPKGTVEDLLKPENK